LCVHIVAISVKLLLSPRRPSRKISATPFKVLDAPDLQDDFYLNLLDWSSQNMLSVGLGAAVYLWSACTSQVSRWGCMHLVWEGRSWIYCHWKLLNHSDATGGKNISACFSEK